MPNSYSLDSQNVDSSNLTDDVLDTSDTNCNGPTHDDSIVLESGFSTSDSREMRPAWYSTSGENSTPEMTFGEPRDDTDSSTQGSTQAAAEESSCMAQESTQFSPSPVKNKSWCFGSTKKSPVSLSVTDYKF